ncbi:MAG TPA: hypothetical protein VGF94_17465 [Kofleriaceae bacterium]
MGRHTREQAAELRGLAPLVVTGAGTPQLVGPCTLVTNGVKTVAFSSSELLRNAGEPLEIALTLDGKRTVRVASWALARATGLGIAELAEPFPTTGALDVTPLGIGSVYATIDTRGAPSALVTVIATAEGFARRIVPVHVDFWDGNGMSDVVVKLASPQDAEDLDAAVEGAALFSWLPPDAVLGRPSEVVTVALAVPYRARAAKPRELAPCAELVGLDDLGRVLPYRGQTEEASNDLRQVAGEIKEEDEVTGPVSIFELEDRKR